MIFNDPRFPHSVSHPFTKTSEIDWTYNCIAWAYGSTTNWFWPKNTGMPTWFWPPNIPTEENIESFVKLFESIGYSLCENGKLEEGFQKVAIYEKNNIPTHAAKQLTNGLWSSKLGSHFDASHRFATTYNSIDYGNVTRFMKRPVIPTPIPTPTNPPITPNPPLTTTPTPTLVLPTTNS